MSRPLEWAGTARGKIIDFGLSEFDSGAVAVSLKLAVQEYFDTESGQWVDCEAEGFETAGDIWVVKKDGTVNDKQVQALCECCGWDGDLTSIVQGTWRPTPCAVVVNREEYKGGVRYRISFVNAFDRVPGQVGNISPEKVQALQDRYGDKFRALAGNVQRNTAVPPGKPPAPRKPAAPPPAAASSSNAPSRPANSPSAQPAAAGTAAPPPGDDIPF